jgi:hypothetical protein
MRARFVLRSVAVVQVFLLLATLVLPALTFAEEPPASPDPTPTSQPSDPPPTDPAPDPTAPTPAPDPTADPGSTEPPAPAAAPTISSDKADYAPGELVTLTGANWAAGESVHIYVNDELGSTWSRSVDITADDTGDIVDQFSLPNWFVANYVVVATGSVSGIAVGSFTDADPTTTTLTSSLNPSNSGQSVTFTAGVTRTSGGTAVSVGQVKFGTGNNCTGGFTQLQAAQTVNSSGVVTFTTSALPTGTTTIRACYLGTGGSGTQDSDATIAQTLNGGDTNTPDTSISTNPSNPSATSSASFSFTGSDDVTAAGSLTFECKLDAGAFAACTSPKSLTLLGEGSHTFSVRAIDGAGNVDPSPASFTWTVDTIAPNTSIDSNPANPSDSSSASFTFSGTDAGTGVASFDCKLDAGAFAACTSPTSYSGLADGSHTFSVRAIDGAGNLDASPASFTWTIDAVLPVISASATTADSAPYSADTWTNQDVAVVFTCADDSGTLSVNSVSSDGGTRALETAGFTFFASGSHCVDAAGNQALTGSFGPIKIDQTAPVISSSAIANALPYTAGTWTKYSVAVSFTCADTGAVQSLIASDTVAGDNATVSAETSGTNVSSDGDCIDNAGNSDSSETFGPIKIDLTNPTLSITSPSTGFITVGTSVTVSGTDSDTPSGVDMVTVNDLVATYGGGTFVRLNVPLSCGSNTITALVTDLAGRTATNSITVTRVCLGTLTYYQPLDQSTTSTPIINIGKFGRVIPVKVTGTLSLGSSPVNMTDTVLAANGLTLRIGVNAAACSNGAAQDAVEAYADAGVANDNTNIFRWSASQWVFNLDTGHAPSVVMAINSCYRLDVYLRDAGGTQILLSTGPGSGSNPYAIFKPTK